MTVIISDEFAGLMQGRVTNQGGGENYNGVSLRVVVVNP
jgi:hypothetical protein